MFSPGEAVHIRKAHLRLRVDSGAVACVIIWRFNSTAAVIAGAAIVFVIRLLAAHFRWSLPKADRFGPVQPQELSENDENTQEI